MPALRDLQVRAYRAILHAESDRLAPHVIDGGIPAVARIQVYQNNAREGFTKTLAASYPVIRKLAGEPCFRSLARQYMLRHPSRSGDRQGFGYWFPAYLEHCYGQTEFDYLADVARLEWASEEVRTAPRAGCIDLNGLAGVPEWQYGKLRFRLHPAHRVVSSPYPVLSIWQANQGDGAEYVDLRLGAEHVLVVRRNGDVELHRWPASLARFTQALGDAGNLGKACELATAADAAFNPADALVRLAALNLLCGFDFATSNARE